VVDGPPAIDIDVKSGSLTVRNGAAHSVRIDIDAGDSESWTVTQNGDQIRVEPPRARVWSRSARVYLEVPTGADLDVRSATADASLLGTFGTIRLKGATGDLAATGNIARLDANTASGDVRIDQTSGDVTCKTASGDAEFGIVGGRITVTTASGDVRVTAADDDVDIGTASGDVRVDRYDGADINVRTTSGRIAVGLPAGIRVEPDLSTLSGRTRLPAPSNASGSADRRVVRVRLRSISGDIDITRV
jgi:DUF4097 and DUF4098 domain-containing protein YvlB